MLTEQWRIGVINSVRTSFPVDNKILTKIKPEEVQLLVSLPTLAAGNRMREKVLSFDELAGKIQLTQLCEKAYFQYRVTAKIRPTDGEQSFLTEFPSLGSYSRGHNLWKFIL